MDGEIVVVSSMVPVKPPEGVTVTVELPVAPLLKSAGEEAEIEKSATPTVKVAVVECVAVPGEPAPLIGTGKAPPVDGVHVNEEVPVALAVSETGVTVNGLQVKPAGTISVRPTVPTKLNVLVRVIVEAIDAPATPLGEVALTVKSPTWTVIGTE
jgi:hypothetical protein